MNHSGNPSVSVAKSSRAVPATGHGPVRIARPSSSSKWLEPGRGVSSEDSEILGESHLFPAWLSVGSAGFMRVGAPPANVRLSQNSCRLPRTRRLHFRRVWVVPSGRQWYRIRLMRTVKRGQPDADKFNQEAILPYELRRDDFRLAMQDLYDLLSILLSWVGDCTGLRK